MVCPDSSFPNIGLAVGCSVCAYVHRCKNKDLQINSIELQIVVHGQIKVKILMLIYYWHHC